MGKLSLLFWILFCSASAFSMNAFGSEKTEYDGLPAPVDNIVYVRPFALSQAYRWSPVNKVIWHANGDCQWRRQSPISHNLERWVLSDRRQEQ